MRACPYCHNTLVRGQSICDACGEDVTQASTLARRIQHYQRGERLQNGNLPARSEVMHSQVNPVMTQHPASGDAQEPAQIFTQTPRQTPYSDGLPTNPSELSTSISNDLFADTSSRQVSTMHISRHRGRPQAPAVEDIKTELHTPETNEEVVEEEAKRGLPPAVIIFLSIVIPIVGVAVALAIFVF